MRIGFASADWGLDEEGTPVPGGANWVRVQTPAYALSALGHEIQIGSSVAIRKTDRKMAILGHDERPVGDPPDVVVLQRWMHRNAPQHIYDARAAGQVVINDVDDWFDGLDPANQAFYTSHPRVNAESNRDHYRKALGASTVITTSTNYLAQRLAVRDAPVEVLRNAIRTTDYDVAPISDHKDGLVVCWVGALNWRSGDLQTIAGFFGPWLREHDCKFLHHGVTGSEKAPSWELLRLEPDQVEGWRPMVVPQTYGRALMKGFDIGLVPLADIPFNRAKSWIKGLEYATAGIPFVAFDSEEYRALNAGLVARRPRDWIKSLTRLLDPEERERQQFRGLQASRCNDIDVRVHDWERVYLDTLARR